jgi:hypothetical protein
MESCISGTVSLNKKAWNASITCAVSDQMPGFINQAPIMLLLSLWAVKLRLVRNAT